MPSASVGAAQNAASADAAARVRQALTDLLDARLLQAASVEPQPQLHLRADRNTRYEAVAQLMAAAESRGLVKLGFVTDPNKENTHGKR
jgi:biopolymer transport protein ExbD